jgi:hypothetical protein
MRPTPIPDHLVVDGTPRLVMAGPGGDLTGPVRPVELLDDTAANGRLMMRVIPEEGDVEKLAAGGALWVCFYGPVPVFTLDVVGPDTHIETGQGGA